MTNFKPIVLVCLALALLLTAVPASAQMNNLYTTTLSNSMTNTQKTACLASATNIVLPSTSTAGSRLFVDHETMDVQSVTTFSSTCFNVMREHPAAHNSGATVSFGPPNWFYAIPPVGGQGSPCTLSSIYAYPYISPTLGDKGTSDIWHCVNSKWVSGAVQPVAAYTAFSTLSNPNALIAATSVTHVDGTEWYSQIFIPANATITGACWLNGATVTTDKSIAVLWDASGAVIANSATAGAAESGANQYQCAAFTSTVQVYGPGSYFVGIQTKGTTDNFLAYATGGASTGYITGNQTGTFGTVAAISSLATGFTTAKGPLMILY